MHLAIIDSANQFKGENLKKILLFLCFGLISLYAKPVVTASILPTKYFVEQIAGDKVETNVMVGVGADPHSYEPKPDQMKKLEKSDLFFAIGIEYEKAWMPKFEKIAPKMKIVDTGVGIERMPMMAHEHHEHECEHNATGDKHECDHDHDKDKHDEHKEHEHHEHGEHDEHHHHHHHGGLDPHIWLDPMLVKTQAKNIANALIAAYPANKAEFEANLAKFEKKLDELDEFAKTQLADVKHKAFIVYHPSWGYFAKRYGLEQIAIEVEGKEPKPAELAELIDEAKEEQAKVIFVAPQFSKKSAEVIAKEVGAKVIEIDQLPIKWDETMRKTIEAFKAAL